MMNPQAANPDIQVYWRCELCDPKLYKPVVLDVPVQDLVSLAAIWQLILDHHQRVSPNCPASKVSPPSVAVDFLVRMVQ